MPNARAGVILHRREVPLLYDEGMEPLIGCMVPDPPQPLEAESPVSRWVSRGLLVSLVLAGVALMVWG